LLDLQYEGKTQIRKVGNYLSVGKSKGKVHHFTVRTAHRGSRGIALPFHDHGTRREWEVSVTPWPFFTPGKIRYPFYRRFGGPQGRSEQVRKISPPPGFDHLSIDRLIYNRQLGTST